MKYIDKVKRTLPVVFLPLVSYFVLGPLEIFAGNAKDFSFKYTDFFGIFVCASLLIGILLSLLLSFLPEKLNRGVGGLVFAVGLASYIQNMFMNIKLSEADGSPMDWTSIGYFKYANLAIWILIFLAVILLYWKVWKYWNTIVIAGSSFLCAIQLVAVISLVFTLGFGGENNQLQMSGQGQFEVATEDNVIVFVIDTLGNTSLQEVVEQNPDMLDGLKDFTYYDNADCHYYCTFPSMTHLLTGVEFDFESKSQDWMESAWTSKKSIDFWNEVRDAGYISELYSNDIGYVYGDVENLNGKFDNIIPVETEVDTGELISLLAKMSTYRYVPYVIKPYFEVLTVEFGGVVKFKDGTAVIEDNGLFYKELVTENLKINADVDKALIIQHLFGVHAPYTTDENGNVVEEATKEQTIRGIFVVLEEYINQLKELELYDEATIIITADHGAWHGGDTQPVFFIKRAEETHGSMQINGAPISLDDFQATILNIIGKDYEAYGTSIYDWSEGDNRDRTVYMRGNDEAYPNVEGSAFNVYYKYTYSTDKNELNKKVEQGPDEIVPATPW